MEARTRLRRFDETPAVRGSLFMLLVMAVVRPRGGHEVDAWMQGLDQRGGAATRVGSVRRQRRASALWPRGFRAWHRRRL